MGQSIAFWRGLRCRRCGETVAAGEPVTRLYVAEDPSGELGLSGTFHDDCATPVWAFAAPKAEPPAYQ